MADKEKEMQIEEIHPQLDGGFQYLLGMGKGYCRKVVVDVDKHGCRKARTLTEGIPESLRRQDEQDALDEISSLEDDDSYWY